MKPDTTEPRTAPDFAGLLAMAITEPGKIAAAYRAFHNYSIGNQLSAMAQCYARGIELGPIASFNRWKELGRHVTKGSKAIELCMPVTIKRKDKETQAPVIDPETGKPVVFQKFVFRRNWFVLAQTDGKALEMALPPTWDADRALAALEITRGPFDLMDGNVQGYALGRKVTVSPVAFEPERTLIHEIAHVVLGHTAEKMTDGAERTPRDIREVEAESVAMLVCAALGLPGIEYSRGYIQHWINQGPHGNGQPIPESSARKIFRATDQILKAGRPAETLTEHETAA